MIIHQQILGCRMYLVQCTLLHYNPLFCCHTVPPDHPVSIPLSTMPGNTTLPTYITEFVSTASLEQRLELQSLLEKYTDSFLTAARDSDSETPNRSQISKFVNHIDELPTDSTLSNNILKELTSLKLRTKGTKGKPAKVKTQWLCPIDKHPNYSSTINKPEPISEFPNISKLMGIVNSHPATSGDMTACLVTCMSTKESSLSYHADDEAIIDQSSDICTVSFGPPLTLDFLWKINNKQGRKGKPIRPDFYVPSSNHSMNIMKAGSQTNILHRVPAGSKGVRYSLSFRKVISQQHPPTEDGPDTLTRCRIADENAPSPKEKVVLLAGDSYFDRLDIEKLAKCKQKVFTALHALQNKLKKFCRCLFFSAFYRFLYLLFAVGYPDPQKVLHTGNDNSSTNFGLQNVPCTMYIATLKPSGFDYRSVLKNIFGYYMKHHPLKIKYLLILVKMLSLVSLLLLINLHFTTSFLCPRAKCQSYNVSPHKNVTISEGKARFISAKQSNCDCRSGLNFFSRTVYDEYTALNITCGNFIYNTAHKRFHPNVVFVYRTHPDTVLNISIITTQRSLVFIDLSTKERIATEKEFGYEALETINKHNLTFDTIQTVSLDSSTSLSDVIIQSCPCDTPVITSLEELNKTHVQCISSGLDSKHFQWFVNGQETHNFTSRSISNYTAVSLVQIPISSTNITIKCVVTSQSKRQSKSLIVSSEHNCSITNNKIKIIITVVCISVVATIINLIIFLLQISKRRQSFQGKPIVFLPHSIQFL